MNKIRDFYYRFSPFVGIAIGLFIIIISLDLQNNGVEQTSYINRQGRTMPFYTSGGLWLGLAIILLSLKKQWFVRFYDRFFKRRKKTNDTNNEL